MNKNLDLTSLQQEYSKVVLDNNSNSNLINNRKNNVEKNRADLSSKSFGSNSKGIAVRSTSGGYRIPRIFQKKGLCGTHGKVIRKNPINNISYHRLCPSSTGAQQGKLD